MNTQFTHKTRYLVCSWIVIVVALGLPACGGIGASIPTATTTPTASPSPTLTETPSPTPTVTLTRRPTLTNTLSSATPTLTTAPPPTSTPASSWNGIPIMPQAKLVKEEGNGYSYTVSRSVEEVQEFYAREMPRAGWESFASGTGETGSVLLLYKKGSKIVTIGAAPQGDVTLVVIVQS